MTEEKYRKKLSEELIGLIEKMGYPRESGEAVAKQLGTEKAMSRMIGYLISAKPGSAEEIADEMLAICSDRDRWRKKK